MADLIDEEGDLLGVVNIVDAAVLLLIGAVLVAGVSVLLVERPSQPNEPTITVEYQSEHLEPYVVDAIDEGPVPSSGIARVQNKTVSPSTNVTQDQFGNLSVRDHPTRQTVTVQLRLNVTTQNDDYVYNGTPIEIGTSLTVDFGQTTVSGRIIGIEATESS